jgi:hypothetical protein
MHHITTPAIAVRPEWALRARLSFGVVDPLLMRAAYDSVGRHQDGLDATPLHLFRNSLGPPFR